MATNCQALEAKLGAFRSARNVLQLCEALAGTNDVIKDDLSRKLQALAAVTAKDTKSNRVATSNVTPTNASLSERMSNELRHELRNMGSALETIKSTINNLLMRNEKTGYSSSDLIQGFDRKLTVTATNVSLNGKLIIVSLGVLLCTNIISTIVIAVKSNSDKISADINNIAKDLNTLRSDLNSKKIETFNLNEQSRYEGPDNAESRTSGQEGTFRNSELEKRKSGPGYLNQNPRRN